MKTLKVLAAMAIMIMLAVACTTGYGEDDYDDGMYFPPSCDLHDACEYIVGQGGAASIEQCEDIYTIEGYLQGIENQIEGLTCPHVTVLAECFCDCIEENGAKGAFGCNSDCFFANCDY